MTQAIMTLERAVSGIEAKSLNASARRTAGYRLWHCRGELRGGDYRRIAWRWFRRIVLKTRRIDAPDNPCEPPPWRIAPRF